MVLNLIVIGLAVTLDPLPLTAFLVVLPSKHGVRKGAAFVSGAREVSVTSCVPPVSGTQLNAP